MKIGDNVKVIRMPKNLKPDPSGATDTFQMVQKTIGKTFKVQSIIPVPELKMDLLELHVGKLRDKKEADYMESIYIEEDCVKKV